jgi:RimJ/RimL family protein N-acetyltransferase
MSLHLHHPASVPPGYPPEYELEVLLRDGRRVQVRPIIPSDAPELAEAIRSADADTLRRRFLGGPPHLTQTLLTHLSTVDYQTRFALMAAGPASRHGVAIARYESLPQAGVAEVAVVVDPAWRRVGLATALVEMLAEAALDRDIHTFSAYYLAQNRPVAALLGLADNTGQPQIRQGIAEFAVALNRDSVAAAIREIDASQNGAGPPVTRRPVPVQARNTSPSMPRHR